MKSPGRPSTSITKEIVNTVVAIIREDRDLLIRELAAQTHMPKTIIHRILKERLHRRHVCSAWVPHFLTYKKMSNGKRTCEEWLEMTENDSEIFKTVVTCNES